MNIIEELRRLTFGEGLTNILVVIGLLLTGFALHRQIRTDRRLEAAELLAARALIKLQRSPGVTRGAAFTRGRSEMQSPPFGQYFIATIKNAGPHMAEKIVVTAALGTMKANIVSAPDTLPPYSDPALLNILIPYETYSANDVGMAIRAGEVLQVRVVFKDGTPAPEPVVQCFVFELIEHDGGRHWVSREDNCPVGSKGV